MNIILIGFMGSGKSTFGRWLSNRQSMDFVDTDDFIEAMEGRTINDIFAKDGEEYFRDLETRVLSMFLGDEGEEHKLIKPTVIAVGGGLPVREVNRELLHKLGKVIFLDAGIDELCKRLSGDNRRPLLKGCNLREKIQSLMDARLDIYDDTADVIVLTDNKSLHEVFEEIKKEWA